MLRVFLTLGAKLFPLSANTQSARHSIPEVVNEVREIPLKNEGRVFSFRISNEKGSRFKITGGFQLIFCMKQRQQ